MQRLRLLHSTPHSDIILKYYLMFQSPVVLTDRNYFPISKAFGNVFMDSTQSYPLCTTKCPGCSKFSPLCVSLDLYLDPLGTEGKPTTWLSLPLTSSHA